MYAHILKYDPSQPRNEKGRWTKGMAVVQAGEYPESNVNVTQHISYDKRFTITPTGMMKDKREQGARGQRRRRFIWSGYRLRDESPTLPKWVAASEHHYTVGSAKRSAEKRRQKYPVG